MPRTGRLCVAIAAAAIAWPSAATASPLGDPALERAVFSGTTAAQAASLQLNPAALGLGSGTHVHLGGTATFDRLAFDRRVVDPDTGELTDGGSATASTWSPGGSIGIYQSHADGFSFGFQMLLPTNEEHPDAGDDFAYHSRRGRHREIVWGTVGGGYRWRDLAFGASLHYVENRVTLRFARDTVLDDGTAGVTADCDGVPCGFENPAAREDYVIIARTTRLPKAGTTFAATFGAAVQIVDNWWVGVSYYSPPGLYSQIKAFGTASVARAPRDGGGTVHSDARVTFTLPQKLRIGMRGRILPGLDVVAEARWEQLSAIGQYGVRLYGADVVGSGVPEVIERPRGLRDQLAIEAGIEQVDVGQRFVLGARAGVERGAADDARLSAFNPYPFAALADAGVQLRIAPPLVLQVGYGLTWSRTADTGRGAYDPLAAIECVDSGHDIDLPACRTVRDGYGLPTASGSYGRIENLVRVTLAWTIP